MKYWSISGFKIPEDASAEDLEELKRNLLLTNEEREFIGNPIRAHLNLLKELLLSLFLLTFNLKSKYDVL